MRRAVFLDRDGVLVKEVHLLARVEDIQILPAVSGAMRALAETGFALVVVTNQPIIGRGQATSEQVRTIHLEISARLIEAGAPPPDAYYLCPHHPRARLEAYGIDCDCRKPRPGMLLAAAREMGIDLAQSFMVGDRLSDIAAGRRAGCRTVLVHSGAHAEPLIESSDPVRADEIPDYTCDDLAAAASWILNST